MLMFTEILTALAVVLFFCFYRLRRQQMSIFKKMGLQGPKPHFLFGNLLAFAHTPMFKKHREWRQEFGETFGYFEGPTPVIVTSNVDMIQEIFIKQFNKFHARKLWPIQVDPEKDEDVHMFFARGRRWKRLRNVVNPAFSGAKIRKMAPTVNECVNHLLDVIKDSSDATSDKTIELLNLFRRLTLDTILRCEVGLDQNSVKNPEDPFLTNCKKVIDDTTKLPILYLLGFIFPAFHSLWVKIYKFLHNIQFNPVYWLEDRMREIVVYRRNIKENKRNDLMQQMVDAQFASEHFIDIENEQDRLCPSRKRILKSMTNEEIVSHALLFLLAGYETTSTTLAYIFYELSQNPNVQQRLRHEVMSILPRGYSQIAYDDLKKLTYLDYVIWETLRKYPLASTVTARQCVEDCTINGMTIPAGMLVHANVWDIQYDPKHWGDDVDSFNPLRFMPEMRKTRHPAVWMPFGGGPRSCAGLRFALLQLKMVVAKVLRDFDFYPSEKLCVPLRLVEGATVLPAEGVTLSAMRRGSAMSESGLRRGSALLGIPLSDLKNIRASSNAGLSDDDSIDEEDQAEEIQCMRRGSLARRRSSCKEYRMLRKNSIKEEDGVETAASRARKESTTKGIELLSVDSVNKGVNILRRASLCSSEDDAEQIDPLRRETIETPSLISRKDVSIGVTSLPGDIVADSHGLRSRRIMRRGSALPELESVYESTTLDEFKSMKTSSMQGSTVLDLPWDCLDKNKPLVKTGRLYQRRGSG